MSVDLTRLLQTLGGSLMGGAVLAPREDYEQKTVLMLAILLMMASEESDRLVARLVEENAAMRRIFDRAGGSLPPAELSERVGRAAAGADPSLRVAPLQEENRALRALLIELHAAVEEMAGGAAGELDEEIWQELVRSNQRRTLLLAPL